MPCIESRRIFAALGLAGLLAACSSPMPPDTPPTATAAVPRATSGSRASAKLGAPGAVRSMGELKLQVAHRIVAANPEGTYTGTVPDMCLAIPVLEIELHGDGSIRRIDVLRKPGQAPETLQMAIDAVRRAAPFGDVSRLPKPWKFSETFLFNDDRKFKPRTLDN